MTGCAPEHNEAAMLMRAVRGAEHQWPELALLHAIPNGGHRGKAAAGKLKAEGVRPGVPDYHLPVARGGYIGLWIELKRTKGGRIQPEQRDWIDALQAQGHCAGVCRGWEEAWAVICDYLASDGPNDEEPA